MERDNRQVYQEEQSQHDDQDDEPYGTHVNAIYTNEFFRHSRPSSPPKKASRYTSERLKKIECEKKAFLDEQAEKEEKFRHLELEKKTLLEIERKAYQEDQDRLLAQQLNGQFNNMHIGCGNKSPPSTPPKTPRSGRCSRTPS